VEPAAQAAAAVPVTALRVAGLAVEAQAPRLSSSLLAKSIAVLRRLSGPSLESVAQAAQAVCQLVVIVAAAAVAQVAAAVSW
jgi:hypothetical protein